MQTQHVVKIKCTIATTLQCLDDYDLALGGFEEWSLELLFQQLKKYINFCSLRTSGLRSESRKI